MAIVPETRGGKIQFYTTHLRAWAEDPPSIGVTAEAVATLADLVAEARDAYLAHRRAQNAARSATAAYHMKVREMHAGLGGGANLLQAIKTFAATSGDPSVYSRANIPPPAPPGRPGSMPAPGTPYAFDVRLFQTGEVQLTWKCDNPGGAVGTLYHIRRQLNDTGEFAFIGTSGAEKSFMDETLPAGTRRCTYEVTALRSTRRGTPGQFPVSFGGVARLPRILPRGEQRAA